MAVTYDATSSGSAKDTFNVSHTCTGSNGYLIVSLRTSDATDISGVTYDSVSMTQLASVGSSTSNRHIVYGLVGPSTGANNITVTFSTAGKIYDTHCRGSSFANVDQTTPLGTVVTSSGTSNDPNVTITTTTDDMGWCGASTNDTIGSMTIGSGTSIYLNDTANSTTGWQAASYQLATGASLAMDFDYSVSADWWSVGVPLLQHVPVTVFQQHSYRIRLDDGGLGAP